MADLIPFADRHNDTEIANNAPITATLMRRIGQNINFLLDLLNVPDGSNTPVGGGIVEFNSPGIFNHIVEPGLNRFWVQCVAGGGGGESVSVNAQDGSTGGGGGGVTQSFVVAQIGETMVVTVGAGGVGGVFGSVVAGNGGNSSVVSLDNNIVAYGGRSPINSDTGGGLGPNTPARGGDTKSDGRFFFDPQFDITENIDEKVGRNNGGGYRGQSVAPDTAPPAGGIAGDAFNGVSSEYNRGGIGGALSGGTAGGGGGGGSYGPGGNGGSGAAAPGSPGVLGGGGGGGAGLAPTGGAGGDGFVRLIIPLIT